MAGSNALGKVGAGVRLEVGAGVGLAPVVVGLGVGLSESSSVDEK